MILINSYENFPDPIKKAAPVAWWSSSSLQGQAEGATIASLPDLSGNNLTVTTSSSGNPVVRYSMIDGKPEVMHYGDSYMDQLSNSSLLEFGNTEAVSMVVVTGDVGPFGNYSDNIRKYIAGKSNNSSDSTNHEYSMAAYDEGIDHRVVFHGTSQTPSSYWIKENSYVDVRIMTKPATVSGGNPAKYYVNNTEEASWTSTATVAAGASDQFRIGDRSRAGTPTAGNRPYYGSWREIAIFDRELTAQEVADITAYYQKTGYVDSPTNLYTTSNAMLGNSASLTGVSEVGGGTLTAETTTPPPGVSNYVKLQGSATTAERIEITLSGLTIGNDYCIEFWIRTNGAQYALLNVWTGFQHIDGTTAADPRVGGNPEYFSNTSWIKCTYDLEATATSSTVRFYTDDTAGASAYVEVGGFKAFAK